MESPSHLKNYVLKGGPAGAIYEGGGGGGGGATAK